MIKKYTVRKILLLGLVFGWTSCLYAQTTDSTTRVWNGKKCAVVLTYDDALDQQLDNALPVLDSLNLKATFYVTAFATSVQHRLNEWKGLATKGHELGNHTLFHPCIGGKGREWVTSDHDMRNYSVSRMVEEIRMTNLFLRSLDGKSTRTFAFTCGDMKVGDSSFIEALKGDFLAARAVRNEMHPINQVDMYNVDCYMVNGETSAQMEQWVQQAMRTNALLVILFHGVGGGSGLDVAVREHSQFLHYLKNNESNIWIAPMASIASYIQSYQTK